MGVYIKGMKMPIGCDDCHLENLTENEWGDVMSRECPMIYKGYTVKYIHERHPDCPLVEVKAPHGRLIDAEGLKAYIYDYASDIAICVPRVKATLNHITRSTL